MIEFKDNLYPDLVYVVSGKVTIEIAKQRGIDEPQRDSIEILQHKYFDYLKLGKQKYKEYTIASVKCVAHSTVVILPYK